MKDKTFKSLDEQIAILKSKGLIINDELYARLLVESKALKSKREIKNALFLKGINSQIVEEKASQIGIEEEKERAITISKKYMKNKEVKLFLAVVGLSFAMGLSMPMITVASSTSTVKTAFVPRPIASPSKL